MKEFFEEFQPRKLLGLTLVWPARIVYWLSVFAGAFALSSYDSDHRPVLLIPVFLAIGVGAAASIFGAKKK